MNKIFLVLLTAILLSSCGNSKDDKILKLQGQLNTAYQNNRECLERSNQLSAIVEPLQIRNGELQRSLNTNYLLGKQSTKVLVDSLVRTVNATNEYFGKPENAQYIARVRSDSMNYAILYGFINAQSQLKLLEQVVKANQPKSEPTAQTQPVKK